MINQLNKLHQVYFKYLLSNSLTDKDNITYQDYTAGSSLLFLFPLYIQLGLAQIFYTCEQITAETYNLINTSTQPIEVITLANNLNSCSVPIYTASLFNPDLNITKYNNLFGFKVNSSTLLKNLTYTSNSIGSIGGSVGSLFSVNDSLLLRDRVTLFFKEVNFEFDQADKFIEISLSNNRVEAALIFCQYFNYPLKVTQSIINEVELWTLNN